MNEMQHSGIFFVFGWFSAKIVTNAAFNNKHKETYEQRKYKFKEDVEKQIE